MGNGCLSERDLALPKSSIFFICFMGTLHVQILRREEKMIISVLVKFFTIRKWVVEKVLFHIAKTNGYCGRSKVAIYLKIQID